MTNPSHPDDLEEESSLAAFHLNFFCPAETRWVSARTKKALVDLFGVSITPGAIYYRRAVGRKVRPPMKLAQSSVISLLHCLGTANELFDLVVEVMREEQNRMLAVVKIPTFGSSG